VTAWNNIKRGLTELVASMLHPQQREVVEVDEWDGAASNYESTEQYCGASLINVNAAAGRDDPSEWTQSHCMLPVRRPGDSDGVYVDKAVYAAAGGRGISAVVRPDDVPEDTWEAAVREAAGKLISAYEQMDETAPDSVYEAAGESPPETERAYSIGQVVEMVQYAMWAQNAGAEYGEEIWLHDLYTDSSGEFYAIGSREGKLYRASITMSGEEVDIGEWVHVQVEHVPVQRGLSIFRQDDGRVRWGGVVCTAVLNRSGEVDSTSLFGSFVERFNSRDAEEDPVRLDFYHEHLFLGTVDTVIQDGYVLIASGLFDDTDIGRAAADGLEREPDYWGASIQYKPTAVPSFVDCGDGVEFPVWEEGTLERIALLPRDRAAAWFTSMNTRSDDMNQQAREALERLLGAEQMAALEGQVDDINERVASDGLIARDADTVESTETDEDTDVDVEQDVETTDDTGETEDVDFIVQLRSEISDLHSAVVAIAEMLPDIASRIEALEDTEQERQRAWRSDLPEPRPLKVVRPRTTRETEDTGDEKPTTEIVAERLKEKGLQP